MKKIFSNKSNLSAVVSVFTLAIACNLGQGIEASANRPIPELTAVIALGPTIPPPVDEISRLALGPTIPPPVNEISRLALGPTIPPPVDEAIQLAI